MLWVSVSALTLLVGQQDEGHSVCKNLPRIFPTDCLPSVLVSANLIDSMVSWVCERLSVCCGFSRLHDGRDVLFVAAKPYRLGQGDSTPAISTARLCTIRLLTKLYRRSVTLHIRNDEMHTDEFKNHRISRYLSAYKQCRLTFQQSFS